MYVIQILACCPDDGAEVAPCLLESASCLIEESISLLLVQLFSSVFIDSVNITYSPPEEVRGPGLFSTL